MSIEIPKNPSQHPVGVRLTRLAWDVLLAAISAPKRTGRKKISALFARQEKPLCFRRYKFTCRYGSIAAFYVVLSTRRKLFALRSGFSVRVGQASLRFSSKKKPSTFLDTRSCLKSGDYLSSQRLTVSTFGVKELNFCVRNGNRWILFAIITAMVIYSVFPQYTYVFSVPSPFAGFQEQSPFTKIYNYIANLRNQEAFISLLLSSQKLQILLYSM